MEEIFAVTETKVDPPQRISSMLAILRARWELENKNDALEEQVREQGASVRDLRERLARADYEQRELLKCLAGVVDECDDMLPLETSRISSAGFDEAVVRHGRRWQRRVERTRSKLVDQLLAYGIVFRRPVGLPVEGLDSIHSRVESNRTSPGEIVEVLRSGLLWSGISLRPAVVSVAAPGASVDEIAPETGRADGGPEPMKAGSA